MPAKRQSFIFTITYLLCCIGVFCLLLSAIRLYVRQMPTHRAYRMTLYDERIATAYAKYRYETTSAQKANSILVVGDSRLYLLLQHHPSLRQISFVTWDALPSQGQTWLDDFLWPRAVYTNASYTAVYSLLGLNDMERYDAYERTYRKILCAGTNVYLQGVSPVAPNTIFYQSDIDAFNAKMQQFAICTPQCTYWSVPVTLGPYLTFDAIHYTKITDLWYAMYLERKIYQIATEQ